MNTMLHLLLENPRLVVESGVVIPCALRDLLAIALDDHTSRFRNEVLYAYQGDGGALLHMFQPRHDR